MANENTQAAFARMGRVRSLYDEIIESTIEGVRQQLIRQGRDDSILAEVKRVSMLLPSA